MEINRLVPELYVQDIQRSLNFYVQTLKFKIDFQRTEDKFAHISYEGAQLMLCQDDGSWITEDPIFPRGRGINLQVEVNNLSEMESRVVQAGISPFSNTKEVWYRIDNKEEGVKEFLIQDPDGYLLRFQQFLGERILQ